MKTIRFALTASLLLGSAVASAGTAFTVSVTAAKVAAGGADACAVKAVTVADSATDTLTVEVDAKLKADLTLSVDGAGAPVVIKAGAAQGSFAAAAFANERLLAMSGGKKVCELILAPPPVDEPPPIGPPSSEVDNSTFSGLDQQARQFLVESKRIVDHEVTRNSYFGRTYRIYHLPSGKPAFPLPRHVNEKDDVEIWMVLPQDAVANVEVSSCDKVPATRVSGSYTAAAGSLQAKERVTFRLENHSKRLNCAGALTYKIDVTHQGKAASTQTSIPFDPVYRFEWNVGYMFDFGRPRKISLGDRPGEDGSASEKFLIESKDYSGAKPVLALSINVCGTNPRDLTWCDRLLNPTLMLDPTRLTSGFGAGFMLRPFHGFGLVAGMTVFKTTAFADGSNANVGDTWSIAGDPSTKEVFNRKSLGFSLALVVSTDVFAELLKKTE